VATGPNAGTTSISQPSAPVSILGTWLLDSVEDAHGGAAPGAVRHIAVARDEPLLAVTFDADGTWHAATCAGAGRYDSCSASCGEPLSCQSGTYTYANGVFEGHVANAGPLRVLDLGSGTRSTLAIPGFFGTFDVAYLVKIDALPSCGLP
jgi:hypothetical protein